MRLIVSIDLLLPGIGLAIQSFEHRFVLRVVLITTENKIDSTQYWNWKTAKVRKKVAEIGAVPRRLSLPEILIATKDDTAEWVTSRSVVSPCVTKSYLCCVNLVCLLVYPEVAKHCVCLLLNRTQNALQFVLLADYVVVLCSKELNLLILVVSIRIVKRVYIHVNGVQDIRGPQTCTFLPFCILSEIQVWIFTRVDWGVKVHIFTQIELCDVRADKRLSVESLRKVVLLPRSALLCFNLVLVKLWAPDRVVISFLLLLIDWIELNPSLLQINCSLFILQNNHCERGASLSVKHYSLQGVVWFVG